MKCNYLSKYRTLMLAVAAVTSIGFAPGLAQAACQADPTTTFNRTTVPGGTLNGKASFKNTKDCSSSRGEVAVNLWRDYNGSRTYVYGWYWPGVAAGAAREWTHYCRIGKSAKRKYEAEVRVYIGEYRASKSFFKEYTAAQYCGG